MTVTVLVPGYGGRFRAVERWRIAVALRTLSAHGGGRLVVSGHAGEAERLAALVPVGADIVIESTAKSTSENVERSLPFLRDTQHLAVASDRFHRRRVVRELGALAADLLPRVVDPVYGWRERLWMDAGGAAYESLLCVRRAASRARKRGSLSPESG